MDRPHRLGLLALVALFVPTPEAGTVDATSGASIHVTGGTTTATSADLAWQETRVNGRLRLYWDTLPVRASSMRDSLQWTYSAVLVNGKWNAFLRPTKATLTGLVPGRTYHFVLQGFYPLAADSSAPLVPQYMTLGSFQTDPATGVGTRRREPQALDRAGWDVRGRTMVPGSNAVFPRVGAGGVTIPGE